MTYEPPTFTDEEKARLTLGHWERVANISDPDTAFQCRDYAKHLRTIAECLRLNMLERDLL